MSAPVPRHFADTARDCRAAKRRLRAWALQERRKRAGTPDPGAPAALCAHVRQSPDFTAARVIGGYLGMPGELALTPLLASCHADGRQVVIPAWNPVQRRYGLCRWTPDLALVAGPLRIPQPAYPDWRSPCQLDLVLVPGVAFDRRGGRLGFGAGHYDRLLACCRPGARFLGIAWSWQVVARVPVARHDVRMHALATPNGVLRCRRVR